MIKIGLICAVLMARPGHVAKQEIMRARCPVLLNPGFLAQAKECMRQAAVSDGPARQELLTRGLFFMPETAWRRGQTIGDQVCAQTVHS